MMREFDLISEFFDKVKVSACWSLLGSSVKIQLPSFISGENPIFVKMRFAQTNLNF